MSVLGGQHALLPTGLLSEARGTLFNLGYWTGPFIQSRLFKAQEQVHAKAKVRIPRIRLLLTGKSI
jgi:hypothetical protein